MPRETACPAVIVRHMSRYSSPLKDAFIESRVLSLSDSPSDVTQNRKTVQKAHGEERTISQSPACDETEVAIRRV